MPDVTVANPFLFRFYPLDDEEDGGAASLRASRDQPLPSDVHVQASGAVST